MNPFIGIVFNVLIAMLLAYMFAVITPTASMWPFAVLGFGVALARILGKLEK